VVYFENGDPGWPAVSRWLLQHLADCKTYAVHASASDHPAQERYLLQARAITPDDLSREFGIHEWEEELCRQPFPLVEFVAKFVHHQRAYWGELEGRTPTLEPGPHADPGGIGFGLIRESLGTFRIWSRPVIIPR
jgi:hypothetical protein